MAGPASVGLRRLRKWLLSEENWSVLKFLRQWTNTPGLITGRSWRSVESSVGGTTGAMSLRKARKSLCQVFASWRVAGTVVVGAIGLEPRYASCRAQELK